MYLDADYIQCRLKLNEPARKHNQQRLKLNDRTQKFTNLIKCTKLFVELMDSRQEKKFLLDIRLYVFFYASFHTNFFSSFAHWQQTSEKKRANNRMRIKEVFRS
ncbi:hypothetical protein ACKWTF_003849 [Chironomus riparius]